MVAGSNPATLTTGSFKPPDTSVREEGHDCPYTGSKQPTYSKYISFTTPRQPEPLLIVRKYIPDVLFGRQVKR